MGHITKRVPPTHSWVHVYRPNMSWSTQYTFYYFRGGQSIHSIHTNAFTKIHTRNIGFNFFAIAQKYNHTQRMHRLRSTHTHPHPHTQTRSHSHAPEGRTTNDDARLATLFLWIHRSPDPSCADTHSHILLSNSNRICEMGNAYTCMHAPHTHTHPGYKCIQQSSRSSQYPSRKF